MSHSFRSSFARLAQLARCLDGTLVQSATLHMRRETDTALISMRLDAGQLSAERLGAIAREAAAAGAAVLEPARLPAEDRRRFYSAYLPLYGLRASNLPTLDDALRLLARWLGMPVADVSAGTAPALDARPDQSGASPRDSRLEVRFRRGDAWQLGRPRSLSAEGLYIASGCLPRHGDVIELELACPPTRAILRAAVQHVTRPDTAANVGIAGFGARFMVADATERRRLHEVLVAARDVVADLTPPPRRRDMRYPLRWPVLLDVGGVCVQTSALDISSHGLFVAGQLPSQGPFAVALDLDDAGELACAQARLARQLTPEVAKQRGVIAGCGLELLGFTPEETPRFDRFVKKVAGRAACQIVVGASPGRAGTIRTELEAAGYPVVVATDAASLVSHAATEARPPDLVVLDGTLGGDDPQTDRVVRRALAVRQIPVAAIDGLTPTATRAMADRVLL